MERMGPVAVSASQAMKKAGRNYSEAGLKRLYEQVSDAFLGDPFEALVRVRLAALLIRSAVHLLPMPQFDWHLLDSLCRSAGTLVASDEELARLMRAQQTRALRRPGAQSGDRVSRRADRLVEQLFASVRLRSGASPRTHSGVHAGPGPRSAKTAKAPAPSRPSSRQRSNPTGGKASPASDQ